MRLLKQSGAGWKYELDQNEGILLRTLVKEFPLMAATVAKITRTSAHPKSAERGRLLNESLAQHRQKIKRQAGKLLAANLQAAKDGWRLSLGANEREILLQLLNDIRVESWHALGEPENLDTLPSQLSEADRRQYHLMHAAGYFEWKMLEASQSSEVRGG